MVSGGKERRRWGTGENLIEWGNARLTRTGDEKAGYGRDCSPSLRSRGRSDQQGENTHELVR